jgi:hypothetical protein
MKKILLNGIYGVREDEIMSTLKYFNLDQFTSKITTSDLNQKVGYCLGIDGYVKENYNFSKDVSKIEFVFLVGIDRESVMNIILYMKEHDIKRPIFSMITPTNIDWIFGDLIDDVYKEHLMMTQGGESVK